MRDQWRKTLLGWAPATLALLLIVSWFFGPKHIPWELWQEKNGTVFLDNQYPVKAVFPVPSLQLWTKTVLGLAGNEWADQNRVFTSRELVTTWVGPLERPFNHLVALNSILSAVLAIVLLRWQSGNLAARRLASALGCFAFALAGHLIIVQGSERLPILAWPSIFRVFADTAVTAAFILSIVRLDALFSTFPVQVEDWQVAQRLLGRLKRFGAADFCAKSLWTQRRSNLLFVIRRLPWVILGFQTVGNALFTLPFLGPLADYDPWQSTVLITSMHQIGFVCVFVGLACWVVSLLLLMAFAWLFALVLAVKFNISREACTEIERRELDWLYAAGLIATFLLSLISLGLVISMHYVAWGGEHQLIWWFPETKDGGFFYAPVEGGWLRHISFVVAVFAFPVGWTLCLFAVGGAVFLSKSFGPRPLFKRTILVAATGLLISLLLTVVQHLVTANVLNHTSAMTQNGFNTMVAGGLTLCILGAFRTRLEQTVEGFLNRFLPANIIADGKRQNLAVVFADLGGYTSLSATHEERALLLTGHFQKVAVEVTRQLKGRVVKTMGDAVMLVFREPTNAVLASLRLSSEFAASASNDSLEALPVNCGIHLGSVVEAPDGDLYGAAVNLASRLQGVAKDGAIIVSMEVVQELSSEFRLKSLGRMNLKNVPLPVACFAVASG